MAVRRTTGEVSKAITATFPVGSIIITPEQQELKRKRQEFFEMKDNTAMLGKFYFLAHKRLSELSPATLVRLIFLGSYTNYGSDELWRTKRSPMKKEDLPTVMGLSDATVSRFWAESAPNYIWTDDGGHLHICADVVVRGTLKEKQRAEAHHKIFIEAIRSLYNATPVSNHKQLGYVFGMLPYINIEFNVLCHNPYERDITKIQFLTVQEFCRKIGYSYAAASRLRKVYSKIKFCVNGAEEQFCSFVYDGQKQDEAKIFVNPNVLYSGKNPQKVQVLGAFCNSGKKDAADIFENSD